MSDIENEILIKKLRARLKLKERRWKDAKKFIRDVLTEIERNIYYDKRTENVEIIDENAINGARNSLALLLANMEISDEICESWEEDGESWEDAQADYAAQHRRRVLFFPTIRRTDE